MLKENIYEIVAFNIRKYRKIKKISTKELAKRTGYSYGYIRRIESNTKKSFSILTIYIIARELDIDIKSLFDEENI